MGAGTNNINIQALTATVAGNSSVYEDLMLLSNAVNYRAWLAAVTRPFIGRRILEVGAGVGNYTEQLLGAECLFATDSDPAYVDILTKRFAGVTGVETLPLDIGRIEPSVKANLRMRRLDTIVCFNVLEHVEADRECVRALLDMLAPGGRLVLIVPALPMLFNSLDRAYGHFRRYRKGELRALAQDNDVTVESLRHFNFPGILGWLWSGWSVRKNLPAKQTLLFDKCVPIIRALENVVPVYAGLSLLAVLRRQGNP